MWMPSARHIRHFSRCATVWIALLGVGTAFADTSKISPDLLPLLANPSSSVNVIIQYNAPPTCNSGGLLGLGGVVCAVGNLLGGIVNGVVNFVFTIVNAIAATVHAGDILTLSNQSNVSYISLDRSLHAANDYTTAAMNAPLAWAAGLD